MPFVKICGLRRPEDADYVNAAGADFAGFVFAEGRRRISVEEAAVLRRRLSGDIVSVGVFVNERPEIIAEAVSAGVIGAVQLHGQETAEYVAGLRKLLEQKSVGGRIPVIQAFCIGDREDLEAALQSKLIFCCWITEREERENPLTGVSSREKKDRIGRFFWPRSGTRQY